MKKKLLALLLLAALSLTLLAGCATTLNDADSDTDSDQNEEQQQSAEAESLSIRLGGLQGPTSMGLVKLLEQNKNGESFHTYDFFITAAIDEMSAKIVKGELDIAAIPANMAAVLYARTEGAVQALAVNTMGVLYMVERGESIQSISDLAGKTIYASGKGATPEYNLKYLLEQNGLVMGEDVTVEFKSENTEVLAALSQDENAVAMLPQPFVTVAQGQVEGLRVALDLTAEWDACGADSRLITGVFVVSTAFAQEHPLEIAKFLEEYSASEEYVTDSANLEEAAALIEEFGIVKAAIAQQALPQCQVVAITGQEMKDALSGYLQVLCDQAPEAVGGAMPDDGFYYVA